MRFILLKCHQLNKFHTNVINKLNFLNNVSLHTNKWIFNIFYNQ